MVRRILKIVAWVVAIFFGIAILLSITLYIPSVQNFLKGKAEGIVSEQTEWNLEVKSIRLKFPFVLAINNVVVTTAEQDTIANVERLELKVSLLPLIRKSVSVPHLLVRKAKVNYSDTTSSLSMRGEVGELLVKGTSLNLNSDKIKVRSFSLSNSDVALSMGESQEDTTDTAMAPWNIVLRRGVLDHVKFKLEMEPSDILLDLDLAMGRVERAVVDLPSQEVGVRSVQLMGGDYSFFMGEGSGESGVADKPKSAEKALAEAVEGSGEEKDWKIEVGRFLVEENSFHYSTTGGKRVGRVFNPDDIFLRNVEIDLDSIYNYGSEIAARIRKISLNEQSGLELTNLSGSIGISKTAAYVRELELSTPNSKLSATAVVGGNVMELEDSYPLEMSLLGQFSMTDINRLVELDDSLRVALGGKLLAVEGEAGGTIGDIDLSKLRVSMPRHLWLNSRGRVRSVLHPNRLAANVNFSGSLDNIEFVKRLIPDTLLRERVAFPKPIKLNGDIAVAGMQYSPKLIIRADSGELRLAGSVNLRNEAYRVVASATDFPLEQFLPKDNLGLLAFELTADGKSFDPTAVGAELKAGMAVERFDFNGYNYSDVALNLGLLEHRLVGKLKSESSAVKIDLDIEGELSPNYYAAQLRGGVGEIDLQQMNFAERPLEFATDIDIAASMHVDSLYVADVNLSKIVFTHGIRTDRFNPVQINASADQSKIEGRVQSGDLLAKLDIPIGIDSLSSAIELTMAEVERQIGERNIDMALVEPFLPPLSLNVIAYKDNPIQTFAQSQGMSFNRLRANFASGEKPLRGGVTVNRLKTAAMTLDTLSVGLGIREHKLYYLMRLANKPGNIEQLALFYIYGKMEGDSATLNFYQRNREKEVGFDVGFNAQLRDSSIRVTIPKLTPTLAYDKWEVNADNFVDYYFDKQLYANLHLSSGKQKIDVASVDYDFLPKGSLSFNVSDVEMGKMLDFLPFPPNLEGYFSLSGMAGVHDDLMIGTVKTSFKDFHFNNQRVGDVELYLGATHDHDTLNVVSVGAMMLIDSVSYLTVEGKYYENDEAKGLTERLDVGAKIESLPLKLLNPFIPNGAMTFGGVLEGDFKVEGTPKLPVMNGQLQFKDADILTQMSGTKYKISSEAISMVNNHLRFNNFGVIAPNKKPLALNGSIDFKELSRPYTDLRLTAREFRAVDSKYGSGAQLFGRADFDANIKLHGYLDAMVMRGGLRLLNTTNLTYQMRDSFLDVEDKEQKIVTFVSFDEMEEEEDSIAAMRVWALDMLVQVAIEEGVKVSVNLSEGGSNRAQLIGGGELAFSMNNQGDTRLTGRYTLSGGEVVYTPPLISTKHFKIAEDSYVSWSGEIANPSFAIKAVDRVTTTVQRAGTSQQELFDVAILIENTIEDLSLRFDLSSPGELQSDISSLTSEERSTQAMSLLLYGTYTGPGATGKVDAVNPLNDFIAKEINEWTRNNFKAVEIKVGLDDVEDAYGGSHVDYSYEVSKSLFQDRLKITIGGSMSDDKNPYTNNKDTFIEDIEIEYRLTKRDNFFLKAFRHSTSESILEGEVIETGGGILLRKKVNTLGELFKFTPNLERKIRREKRKEEKRLKKEREEQDVEEQEYREQEYEEQIEDEK